MKKQRILFAAILLFINGILWAQNQIAVDSLTVSPGDSIEIPVYLSSDQDIAFVQIIVEFDTMALQLAAPNIRVGSDAAGLQLGLINTSLVLATEDSTANRQVLFQLSGGGTQSIRGENLEIAKLLFDVKDTFTAKSSIHIDRRLGHSFLTTINLVDLSGAQIDFIDGEITLRDAIPPTGEITFPADTSEFGLELITVTGTAADSGGSGVISVEISLDGGLTWQTVEKVNGSFEQWKFDWLPQNPGWYTLLARATDGELNVGTSQAVWVHVLSPVAILSFPTQTDAQIGAVVAMPLTLKNAENIGFVQVTVAWDSSALRLQDVFPGTDTAGLSIVQINRNLPFAAPPGTNANALFQLAGDGVTALSGAELEIALLQFKAVGLPDSTTPVLFDSTCTHTYLSTNDLQDMCSPAIILIDGTVRTIARDEIDGTVSYFSNNQAVAAVTVKLQGPEQAAAVTDAAGAYAFKGLFRGHYTVIPAKTGGTGNAISASDALAIMQSAAFLRELTPTQKLAADVDGNGLISGADAMAVLRYAAFFTSATAATGEWSFNPASHQFDLVGQATKNFIAFIFGDVTGNWQQSSLPKAAESQPLEIIAAADENGALIISLFAAQNATKIKAVNLTLQWQQAPASALVYTAAKQQQAVLNPENSDEAYLALASLEGFTSGEKIGDIRLSPTSIPQDGELIASAVQIITDDSAAPDIPITMNTTAVAEAENEALSTVLNLQQNYPNPFNMETIISFLIPEKHAGSRVQVHLLNLKGQTVDVLFDAVAGAGNHTCRWSGTDSFGRDVSSGTYLYRMQVGNIVKTRKLLLLR